MSEKQKKLIAKRKKTTTTIVQVVYVEWKLYMSSHWQFTADSNTENVYGAHPRSWSWCGCCWSALRVDIVTSVSRGRTRADDVDAAGSRFLAPTAASHPPNFPSPTTTV